MFEKAVRLKLRFDHKGVCSVEDLWDLSVQELDNIFKGLNVKAKTMQEESLLQGQTKEDELLQLKIDVVKHVVTVKLQEQEVRKTEQDKRFKKQKLLALLEEKQDAQLRDLTPDQLQEMISNL
jgi:hypothetical protein